ncbi:hypothetical protein EYF80_003335 [Liparis tanakae]|uniref:Uncharacterized protein n=1 Tax=Liparis tanakae TaxID=230148 RepID=A0A4Z2J872_9TELE|nr:hypothetical protein EYF80_003335 [Liparis tanakae]
MPSEDRVRKLKARCGPTARGLWLRTGGSGGRVVPDNEESRAHTSVTEASTPMVTTFTGTATVFPVSTAVFRISESWRQKEANSNVMALLAVTVLVVLTLLLGLWMCPGDISKPPCLEYMVNVIPTSVICLASILNVKMKELQQNLCPKAFISQTTGRNNQGPGSGQRAGGMVGRLQGWRIPSLELDWRMACCCTGQLVGTSRAQTRTVFPYLFFPAHWRKVAALR